MPIDFSVFANDGTEYEFHIPNNWFVKKTDATVLKKWHAWGKLYPTYTTTITIPSGIDNVVIDPSDRLADSYMLNNSQRTPYNQTATTKQYTFHTLHHEIQILSFWKGIDKNRGP